MWMYKKDIFKSILETYLHIDNFGIEYFFNKNSNNMFLRIYIFLYALKFMI